MNNTPLETRISEVEKTYVLLFQKYIKFFCLKIMICILMMEFYMISIQ